MLVSPTVEVNFSQSGPRASESSVTSHCPFAPIGQWLARVGYRSRSVPEKRAKGRCVGCGRSRAGLLGSYSTVTIRTLSVI